MSRRITLKKATRVEGNADIHIEVKDGRVRAARLMVQDFRGFEKFCVGTAVDAVPHQVSRICGLCCTSHQVAGFTAVEEALGIEPPPAVTALRRVMLLGEWIASHSLSYFFLTLPDALGMDKGLMDLMRRHPRVVEKAFDLRRQGQRIVHLLGKRAVHPVSLGIGRFTIPPTPEELAEVRAIAVRVMETIGDMAVQLQRLPLQNNAMGIGDGLPLNFLTYGISSGTECFSVCDGHKRLVHQFDKAGFEDHVDEIHADWTFAKFPYLKARGFPEGILFVGPLARLNRAGSILDDPEIRRLAPPRLLQVEALTLEDTDVCRLLEIFWAARTIRRLLDDLELDFSGPDMDLAVSGKGIGVVEAPRGVLVHSYLVKRGVLERMRLLVATQFNNPFINLMLKELAQKHVDGDGLTVEGEAAIGKCLRIFDPCLSCATH